MNKLEIDLLKGVIMAILFRVVGCVDMLTFSGVTIYTIIDYVKKGPLSDLFPLWLGIILLVAFFIVGTALGLLFFGQAKTLDGKYKNATREDANYYTGENLREIKEGDRVVLTYKYKDHDIGESGKVISLKSLTAAVEFKEGVIEVKKSHIKRG